MATMNMSRGLRLLLAASLGLNLLVVGAVGAFLVERKLQPQELAYRFALRQLTQPLGRADAKLVRGVFADHHTKISAAYDSYRAALRQAITELQQTPRDDLRLQAAIADARAKRLVVAELVFDALTSSIESVSPQGRDALLAKIEQ